MRLRWVALGVLMTALVSVGGTVLGMDMLFSGSPSDIVYSRSSEDVGTPSPAVQDAMLNYWYGTSIWELRITCARWLRAARRRNVIARP
jgi:hypothetical protein